jgi:excinuclease ABC subunit C
MPGDSLPLRLDRKSIALRYIEEIRDEAHRFAITYNRLLRKKKILN